MGSGSNWALKSIYEMNKKIEEVYLKKRSDLGDSKGKGARMHGIGVTEKKD